MFLFLIRNIQIKYGKKHPDPFNLASGPAEITTIRYFLYGCTQWPVKYIPVLLTPNRKIIIMIFLFNISILSNQRKHWRRRSRKEGRMKASFQCSRKLIQLYFLQQTLKIFTVSDNYLCTSWWSAGLREWLSHHVRTSSWFKVEMWQGCSRL